MRCGAGLKLVATATFAKAYVYEDDVLVAVHGWSAPATTTMTEYGMLPEALFVSADAKVEATAS